MNSTQLIFLCGPFLALPQNIGALGFPGLALVGLDASLALWLFGLVGNEVHEHINLL